MEMKKQKNWLTEEDLAKVLKVSIPWLKKARKEYGLPFYKIEGLIRYDDQEIAAWLETKKVEKKAV